MSENSEVTYDRIKKTIKRVLDDKIGCGIKNYDLKIQSVFEAESRVEGE